MVVFPVLIAAGIAPLESSFKLVVTQEPAQTTKLRELAERLLEEVSGNLPFKLPVPPERIL